MKRRPRRRAVPATELRVHLGEALRALDEGELVIEKGGVPVAVLRRWAGEGDSEEGPPMDGAYAAALSRRARPGGLAAALEAMARGWSGIDADLLAAEVIAARDAGASDRSFAPGKDDDDEGEGEGEDAGEVPGRQRHLYRRARRPDTRVADEPDQPYSP